MIKNRKIISGLNQQAKRIGNTIWVDNGRYYLEEGIDKPVRYFKSITSLSEALDAKLEAAFSVEIKKLMIRHPEKKPEKVARAFLIPNQILDWISKQKQKESEITR